MKVLSIIISLIFLLSTGAMAFAPGFLQVAGGGGAVVNPCSGFLICQNFEGTGYDNSETWTESGTVNPDSTSTPLTGSQSFVSNSDVSDHSSSISFSAQSTVYVRLKVRFPYLDNAATTYFLQLLNSSTVIASIGLRATDELRFYHGTAYQASSALSTNTTYYIWIKYVSGTGSNGVLESRIGTTGVYNDATAVTSVTTGTSTASADKILIGKVGSTLTSSAIIDSIYVSSSSLSDF